VPKTIKKFSKTAKSDAFLGRALAINAEKLRSITGVLAGPIFHVIFASLCGRASLRERSSYAKAAKNAKENEGADLTKDCSYDTNRHK
jgi:hypothetical protein